jgi:hypothetical protein
MPLEDIKDIQNKITPEEFNKIHDILSNEIGNKILEN